MSSAASSSAARGSKRKEPAASDSSKRSRPSRPEDEPLQFFSRSKDPTARVFSNFAPSEIQLDGRFYPTVEHAYQGAKFVAMGRGDLALQFSAVTRDGVPDVGADPKAAKKAGSKAEMRKLGVTLSLGLWARKGPEAMLRALRAKFQLPEFRAALLATGTRPLHHFERMPGLWGTNVCKTTGLVRGQNLLGRQLEQIRADLQ